MARKIARLILTAMGAGLGAGLVLAVDNTLVSLGYLAIREMMYTWGVVLIYMAAAVTFGIILYFSSARIVDGSTAIIRHTETKLTEMSVDDIFFSVIGLVVGLIIAFLVSTLTAGISVRWLAFMVGVVFYLFFGYLGWTVMRKRKNEFNSPSWLKRKMGKDAGMARPKVLDTSVIIDGRIADICNTGIIEGTLIVPKFVLRELQHIADNPDALKRNRGRRGLDILKMMQEEGKIPLSVVETDYEDVAEVDAKLIRLAAETDGVVVTNDYNLNKVAGVQNVSVLNINELTNAVKPLALPGEEMFATIIKEGKEPGQGIAYLDDGTMIVVEGGKRLLGEAVAVIVTSVLQTAAGRMIFAKVK